MTSVASDPAVAALAHNGTPAIETSSLHKVYSEGLIFRKKFHALKGLDLTVNQGEIFGLLGPNGAGKTTFIKVLLGIIKKTSGSATMMGYPAGSQRCRKLVGYLPERLRIAPHLNAYTALEYLGNLSNVPNRVIRAKRDEYLELVGLRGRQKESVSKFSKGMVQRLGLAQALLHEPRLLILDEPTDGLDPRARAEMRTIIRDLADRGVTIFLNSHLLQEVEMICERVAILNKGNLRYCGLVADIEKEMDKSELGGAAAVDSKTTQKYRIQVLGDVETLRKKLGNPGLDVVMIKDGIAEIRIEVDGQSGVDTGVDLLRKHGFSIVSMIHDRVTLEDAFLKMVD